MAADNATTSEIEPSPVIIGGVGGSGTRVLWEIVTRLGWNLGTADLNIEKDYTGFTLLFKDARYRSRENSTRSQKALKLIEAALRGLPRRHPSNLLMVLGSSLSMAIRGHNHEGAGRGLWSITRGLKLLFGTKITRRSDCRWGFKEPNSHIYLDELAQAFPNLKYIHLMRHGLDMAFSGNQQQLMKWGSYFDVQLPQSKDQWPKASLEYWLRANERALSLGEQLGPERFIATKLEDLCESPRKEIARLSKFLTVEPGAKVVEELAQIPKMPQSFGRYREHDLSQFEASALERIRVFGYEA